MQGVLGGLETAVEGRAGDDVALVLEEREQVLQEGVGDQVLQGQILQFPRGELELRLQDVLLGDQVPAAVHGRVLAEIEELDDVPGPGQAATEDVVRRRLARHGRREDLLPQLVGGQLHAGGGPCPGQREIAQRLLGPGDPQFVPVELVALAERQRVVDVRPQEQQEPHRPPVAARGVLGRQQQSDDHRVAVRLGRPHQLQLVDHEEQRLVRRVAPEVGEGLRHAPLDDLQLALCPRPFRRRLAEIESRLDPERLQGQGGLQPLGPLRQPLRQPLAVQFAVLFEEPQERLHRVGPAPVRVLRVCGQMPGGVHGEHVPPDQRLRRVARQPL